MELDTCPEEMVVEILNCLPVADLKNMTLVSKRYNSIIGNSTKLMGKFGLTLRVDTEIPLFVGSTLRCLTEEAKKILTESARKYQKMELFRSKIETIDGDLKLITNLARYTKEMEFSQCEHDHNAWTSLLKVVESVEKLSFFRCQMSPIQLSEDIAKITFGNLKVLKFSCFDGSPDSISLQILKIMDNKNLNELEIAGHNYAIDLWEFLNWAPHLTTLDFGFSFISAGLHQNASGQRTTRENDPTYLQAFVQRPGKVYNPPKLQHLKLMYITNADMQPFKDFIKTFSMSLVTLNLRGFAITVATFMELLNSLTLLENITLHIADREWDNITSFGHENIKEIDVFFEFNYIVPMMQVLSVLPNLEILTSNVEPELITALFMDKKLQKLKKRFEYETKPEPESGSGSDELFDEFDDDYDEDNEIDDDYEFDGDDDLNDERNLDTSLVEEVEESDHE